MILLISRRLSGSTDGVVYLLEKRGIPVFRFNLDMYDQYQFLWNRDGFEIMDKTGRKCSSETVETAAFYKGLVSIDEVCDFENGKENPRWIKSWINQFHFCFAKYLMSQGRVRLWTPFEVFCTKPSQMALARKYFQVPDASFHWGFTPSPKMVITKPLTSKPLDDNSCAFAKIVDRSLMDPIYPWFTQDIAPGTLDATVLYINGHVHPFKFATPRGSLSDWRVTQGTEKNKWEPWDAGPDFEENIRSFMRDMGLMFGRLDFIIGGDQPQFLEVNPCGQFGWLDNDDLSLHNEVVDALLDPACTLRL